MIDSIDYYVKPIALKLKINPEIPILPVVNTILIHTANMYIYIMTTVQI